MKTVIVTADELRLIISRLRCLHDSLREMADDVDDGAEWQVVANDWREDAWAAGRAAEILSAMADAARPRMVM